MSNFAPDWSFTIPTSFDNRMAFRRALEQAIVDDLAATRVAIATENGLAPDDPAVDTLVGMLADWWRLHITSAEETEKLQQWWGKS